MLITNFLVHVHKEFGRHADRVMALFADAICSQSEAKNEIVGAAKATLHSLSASRKDVKPTIMAKPQSATKVRVRPWHGQPHVPVYPAPARLRRCRRSGPVPVRVPASVPDPSMGNCSR